MQRFTYDEAKMEMSRREEGLRRAQRNGTAYEFRPKRRFSIPWLRRSPGAANPEPTTTPTYGPASPNPS